VPLIHSASTARLDTNGVERARRWKGGVGIPPPPTSPDQFRS
jgi:hypothetical protein